MKIEVCELLPKEDVENLLDDGGEQCRPRSSNGAWCRFRGALVEGVAWVVSSRLTDNQPPFARDRSISVTNIVGDMTSVYELPAGSCTMSVETSQEEVRKFRKLDPASTAVQAMDYLSVPGRFGVRGSVACVIRADDGTALVADIVAGDASFQVDSDDVGGEEHLSALAEGDAVEFEVRCLALFDEGY